MDTGTLTYNEWADKAVKLYAKSAMERTGHRVIGTPHILMGVLKEGPAANLLIREFGVKPLDVTEIVRDMPKPLPQGIGDEFLYTDGAKAVLEKARELSTEYGFRHRQIYTDHLLVGLNEINDEPYAFIMSAVGVDHDKLQVEAMKSLVRKSELAND
jgi:ATP-dependent Clp protease ATP-binding subunit ClpA